ncbi:hypothetical protein NKI88_09685 [Mesorhizobium sp. M0317]|uniref:hypothetical protein n=1 Tax=Mesorhizobium sp. M0317 TaxID=2956935 RepID=UPI00333916A9
MKLTLANGRFYLGIARLFMPPLEQARGAAAICWWRASKKEEPGFLTWKPVPPDLFAGFSELLNFVSGVYLGECVLAGRSLALAGMALLWPRLNSQ